MKSGKLSIMLETTEERAKEKIFSSLFWPICCIGRTKIMDDNSIIQYLVIYPSKYFSNHIVNLSSDVIKIPTNLKCGRT